jgi:DNA-binding NtrC family response regulator
MVFGFFKSRSGEEANDVFNQQNEEDDDNEPIGDTPITSSSLGAKVKPRIENSTLKILVIGDSGTGKTSLLERYSSGKWRGNTTPTIG